MRNGVGAVGGDVHVPTFADMAILDRNDFHPLHLWIDGSLPGSQRQGDSGDFMKRLKCWLLTRHRERVLFDERDLDGLWSSRYQNPRSGWRCLRCGATVVSVYGVGW